MAQAAYLFPRGHSPWNKGKRTSKCSHSPDLYVRCPSGQPTCLGCARDRRQRYKQNHPIETKACNRLRPYKLTRAEFDAMWEAQNGCCAICGEPFKNDICSTSDGRGKNGYRIDHDEETGEVRGLLCHCCNTGIGFLKHLPLILSKAIVYLDRTCQKSRT